MTTQIPVDMTQANTPAISAMWMKSSTSCIVGSSRALEMPPAPRSLRTLPVFCGSTGTAEDSNVPHVPFLRILPD